MNPIAKKITIPEILLAKKSGIKLSMMTAYDYTMAKLLDQAGIDILLVGDSLGMVVQGRKNTLGVTMDHMIYHSHCVSMGATRAHVVMDMPFMSYQSSQEEAIHNCGMALKKGKAHSVKMEGGIEIVDIVKQVVDFGIPVMGHVGLKPQYVHAMGGFLKQGKDPQDAKKILKDAKAIAAAGAYAIVLESIPAELAEKISKSINIPTIGIGSGSHCDGQVLVCYDFLGMNPDDVPGFVKPYAKLSENIIQATKRYITDIQSGNYPPK